MEGFEYGGLSNLKSICIDLMRSFRRVWTGLDWTGN